MGRRYDCAEVVLGRRPSEMSQDCGRGGKRELVLEVLLSVEDSSLFLKHGTTPTRSLDKLLQRLMTEKELEGET